MTAADPVAAGDGVPPLTVADAARALGVRGSLVRRWIAAGRLRATLRSVGRRPQWEISPADFLAFARTRRLTPGRTRLSE